MAEALIKYETIDTEQINDIMEGRAPRPPQDWDDGQSNGSGTVSTAKPEEKGGKGGSEPIGGPAGQH